MHLSFPRLLVQLSQSGRRTVAIAVACLVIASYGASANADEPFQMTGARVVGGPVTPTIVNIDIRDLPSVDAWEPGDPIKEIPRRFYPPKDVDPMSYEANPDPLVDLQAATAMRNTDDFSTPIVNIGGQGYTGVSPPDTVGDIGPSHYIQSINDGGGAVVQIYDKTGATIGSQFAMDSFGSGACASGYGDPIVLYDRLADRWVLQEFSSSGNYMCFYISQNADPVSGGWYHYGFQAPSFPDYPHFGVWPDAYYGTANEGAGSAVYAFDRTNMLTGAAATMQRFTIPDLSGYGFQAATPADLDGADAPPAGSPGIIMRHVDEEAHSHPNNAATDLLEIFAFDVDWATPGNSTVTQLPDVVITDFNSWMINYSTFYSVPQPSGGGLDPIREVILNRLQYRNFGSHESLVGVLPTNAYTATSGSDVSAALRWFELRRTSGDWQVHQEGTFATSDLDENRFVGSIAMDQSGNIGMGYSITDVGTPSIEPSLRYTGRLADDPAGVMTQIETQQVTGSGAGGGRWGDYASINLDPEDDCTYWFTSEFQNGSGWATQITSFQFDACGCDITIDPLVVTAVPAILTLNLIEVSWNDSATPSVAEYLVYRSRTTDGPYDLIATVPDSSLGTGSGAGYQWDDSDVSGGIEYFYIVRASDGEACRSDNSNEAAATANGSCTLSPIFDGVVSVTNPQSSDCELEIAWAAGSHECGTSVTYNLYRSTTPGFDPDPSNLVASCVDATSHVDTTAFSATTYFYVVRAEDDTSNGAGPCGGGNEDGNLAEASGAATGPDSVYFADDMESGGGNWTHGGTGDTWTLSTARAHSGTTSFFATDVSSVTDQQLASLEFALPNVPGITLEFWSWQEVEDASGGCYDGGIVEASTDGGSNWAQLPDSAMLTLPYDGPVDDGYANPIANQDAWCGDPRDWTFKVVDLTAYAGADVTLRFRLGTDSSVGHEGWYVDDVRVITPSECFDDTGLFRDGFESGDTSAWDVVSP